MILLRVSQPLVGFSSASIIIIFFIDVTEYLIDTTEEKYLFWLIL